SPASAGFDCSVRCGPRPRSSPTAAGPPALLLGPAGHWRGRWGGPGGRLGAGRFPPPRPAWDPFLLPPRYSPSVSPPLSPRARALPPVAKGGRLRPAYDRAFADWLFAELARVESRGHLHAWALPGAPGNPLGWFIYYLLPRDTAKVVQVAAAPGAEEPVLHHL